MIKIPATVYLIHFARPYRHAKHYVGYTALESVEDRMHRHRNGNGSRLLQVVTQAGIDWWIARLWQFDTIGEARKKERQLKNHSAGRNCPVCQSTGVR